MPNQNVETNVIIKAKTEGFQQAQQQIEQITKTASAALERQVKGFDAAQQAITKFVQQTITAGQRVNTAAGGDVGGRGGGARGPGGAPPGHAGGGGGDKGLRVDFSPLMETLTDLKDAILEQTQGQKQKNEEERKRREEEKKDREKKEKESLRRSFGQGFLQTFFGGDVAGFLEDKPGMQRQVAGQYVGRHLRQAAGGFGQMLTGGASGLPQLMQAVPVLGGLLGPITSNLVQYAQMAKTYEKSALGMSPLLSGGGRISRGGADLGGLNRVGLNLAGMNAQEALGMAGGVLQAGGGNIQELRRQGMMGAMYAGRTAYGLDEGTMGAFLKAGRRGGISGVEAGKAGAGGEALATSIGDAVRLGLEGSELQKYMQVTAEGIEKWDATGIPFSRDAFRGFSEALAGMGIAGPRGARVAAGLMQGLQGITDRGPQTGYDIAAMKIFGGWTGKGGAMEYAQTMARMEKLKETGGKGMGKQLQEYLNLLLSSGGEPGVGIAAAKQGLKGLGVQMSWGELTLLQKERTGTLDKGEKAELERLKKQLEAGEKAASKKGVSGLEAQAAKVMGEWGGAVKATSGIQNQQLAAGQKMLGVVNQLDSAAIQLTSTLGDKLMPAFQELASSVSGAVTWFKKFTEGDVGTWDKMLFGGTEQKKRLSEFVREHGRGPAPNEVADVLSGVGE
jgi:hypothetical protein